MFGFSNSKKFFSPSIAGLRILYKHISLYNFCLSRKTYFKPCQMNWKSFVIFILEWQSHTSKLFTLERVFMCPTTTTMIIHHLNFSACVQEWRRNFVQENGPALWVKYNRCCDRRDLYIVTNEEGLGRPSCHSRKHMRFGHLFCWQDCIYFLGLVRFTFNFTEIYSLLDLYRTSAQWTRKWSLGIHMVLFHSYLIIPIQISVLPHPRTWITQSICLLAFKLRFVFCMMRIIWLLQFCKLTEIIHVR